MPLTDFVDVLPEDKREAFKAEIAKAVYITNEADAERIAESNEFLRKANQKYRDPKIQEFKDRFLKEDVPKLLEAERAKGQKQPWELEIEKLKAETEAAKKENLLEKQRNRAMAKAQELGIPASLVDKFVGVTDEETDNGLKYLADIIVPLKKAEREAALKEVGRQPAPKGGTSSNKVMSEEAFNRLPPKERAKLMNEGWTLE